MPVMAYHMHDKCLSSMKDSIIASKIVFFLTISEMS